MLLKEHATNSYSMLGTVQNKLVLKLFKEIKGKLEKSSPTFWLVSGSFR